MNIKYFRMIFYFLLVLTGSLFITPILLNGMFDYYSNGGLWEVVTHSLLITVIFMQFLIFDEMKHKGK